MPELVTVLVSKGKEEGERREEGGGRKRRGEVMPLIPQVKRRLR